jgi:hypothetical protein
MENNLDVSSAELERRIFFVRGTQVMLDSDLAVIYGVTTKRINEQVKRNTDRFPEDFMFQLNPEEWENLRFQLNQHNQRSQNATFKSGQKIARKYRPFVFTEHGIAGLSGVLKSESASRIHVAIMRAFVAMRKRSLHHQHFHVRLDEVERKQMLQEQKLNQVLTAMEKNELKPAQGIFFDGQIFDAYELASRIIRSAKEEIILIDHYIDESTFLHLAKKKQHVKVLLLSKAGGKQILLDLEKVNAQYGGFELKAFTQSHDRFLIIDRKEIYHLGASLKDLGKRWFAFSRLESQWLESLMKRLENQ